jgi:arylsulfatase A-like enzyme
VVLLRLVPAGWDFINPAEVTIASVMAAAGYRTAHMGKWHNAQVRQLSTWHSIALCIAAYVEGNAAPSIADMQLRHQQQGHNVVLECL